MDYWNKDCLYLAKLMGELEKVITKVIRNAETKEEMIEAIRELLDHIRNGALEQMR